MASYLLISPSAAFGAGANELTNGVVDPTAGTTDTTFSFSVTYTSAQGRDATQVVARVANTTVELALVSGTSTSGTYHGSSRLPSGIWPVMFEADASHGKDPMLAGPTLTVQPAATPAPTPAPPAPAPVAPPVAPPPPAAPPPVAPAPAPPAPAPDPAAAAPAPAEETTATGGVVAVTVTGDVTSQVPDGASSPTELGPMDNQPWMLMGLGLAGIVGLAATAFFIASRRRRHPTASTVATARCASPRAKRQTAAARPAAPPATPPAQRRPRADWELYAGLDNEPIGTVGLRNGYVQEGSDLPVNSPSANSV